MSDIEAKLAAFIAIRKNSSSTLPPGLIMVGEPAASVYHPEWGALMGRRVLLPGSQMSQKKSADAIRDFGGVPVPFPLLAINPDPKSIPVLKKMREYDWLIITSPSSVEMLMRLLPDAGLDTCSLPKIIVSGPGTAETLNNHGIVPEVVPSRNFGTRGLLREAKLSIPPGARVLRLRSQMAGLELTRRLSAEGCHVQDCVIYRNKPLRPQSIPEFDAVFFASGSAVEAFMLIRPPVSLADRLIAAMGQPTLAALEKYGVEAVHMPAEVSLVCAIEALATIVVNKEMEKLS